MVLKPSTTNNLFRLGFVTVLTACVLFFVGATNNMVVLISALLLQSVGVVAFILYFKRLMQHSGGERQ